MKRTAAVLAVVALTAAVWLSARGEREDASATSRAAAPEPATPPAKPEPASRRPRAPATDDPAAESPPAAAPAPVVAQRVLRLIDGAGEPLPCVWVRVSGKRERTDADGRAAFPSSTPVEAEYFDGVEERAVLLREPLTEVKIERFPAAVVGVIDGTTGASMPGVAFETRQWPAKPSARPSPPLVVDDWGEARIDVLLHPPAGYGVLDCVEWRGEVASRATAVRLTVPVFPLRDVTLLATNKDGAPVAQAHAIHARIRRRWDGVTFDTTTSTADGLLRVRVPAMPFQSFDVRVGADCADDPEFELGAEVVVHADGSSDGPVRVVLVRRRREFTGGHAGTGRPSDCRFGAPSGPAAPLRVRLSHADGAPARRVTVRPADQNSRVSEVTDADGVAHLEAVPLGNQTLLAAEHGFLPTLFRADVGKVAEVAVTETPGRIVEVIVVDWADRRLPAARVASRCVKATDPADGAKVSMSVSVAQLDGDVELATPRTGADGVLRLREPAGLIRYEVELGGARETVESEADHVRVVLRPPKD